MSRKLPKILLLALLCAAAPFAAVRAEGAAGPVGPESAAPSADLGRRHVALEGQSNFRDLGGYATADGRHVKWGLIFRSGERHG